MNNTYAFFPFLLFLPFLAFCDDLQVFIVYFGEHTGDKAFHEIEDFHHSYLLSVKESDEDARSSLLYSYKHSINGFAAMLTPDEASKLSKLDEVTSVIRSNPRKYSLQTTRSWDFLGLEEGDADWHLKHHQLGDGLLQRAKYGREVIVGILDSGVWPESKCFSDEGMGSIPKSWKGVCQSGQDFNSSHCNRKLIGARYYLQGYEQRYGPLNTTLDSKSPRDLDGHGTHTASTVGGRSIPKVSALGGFGRGTVSGGAPLIHLAIYKVCWAIPGQSKVNGNTCFEEDMLAAFDDAIADGVHIISVSIGTQFPIPYAEDGIALGALHAAKKNIVVACAAGNFGPTPSTLSNPAPWIITVGASSLDRRFVSPVILGNGERIEGETVTPHNMRRYYPLVHAGDVVTAEVPKTAIAGQCLPGSLSPEKVKGKIVLCFRGNGTRMAKGMEAKRAGAAGFILGNSPANGAEIPVDAHVLPATAISSASAQKILQYINSTSNPTAALVPAKTRLHAVPAPLMASFTSKGPNVIDPNILKPDITAPGLNILAAWSRADSPSKLESDHRVVAYNFESGTSMACPHVAAVSALLRAIHPNWSSAAIRSALITTANPMNNIGLPITDAAGNKETPFAFGSGHLSPQKSADPGLLYDASYTDYTMYLCGMGIKDPDKKFKCPRKAVTGYKLNYPSLQVSGLNNSVSVKRTVTNVGRSYGTYFSYVSPPRGYSVKIRPSVLFFDQLGQKKSFTIKIKPKGRILRNTSEYYFGWYSWSDGIHIVRSPMAISPA
ncbi:hypothetical protein CDL15_Pgr027397 [Punica granatum]|uniref:Subtilisin-like protease SBT5.6 n=1 Tax=Punica granatum TaxID=22663 RepID=A0A218Y1E6_PUNGR|nr:hypothetical protein CDL15_Pgr027397 [Punica granatum]PKI36133.1 hypothetical protein CRG98_043477 [Punica granatum]